MLGKRWSANANFISMATYSEEDRVRQSTGPTIASMLDFTDGSFRDERFVVEDDGFPNLLLNVLKATSTTGARTRFGRHLLKEFEAHLRDDTPLRDLMLWLGAGKDAADGRTAPQETMVHAVEANAEPEVGGRALRRRAQRHAGDASEPDRGDRRPRARRSRPGACSRAC